MKVFAILLLSLGTGGLILSFTARGEDRCFLTDLQPTAPFGLELCYMHSHNACCLSGFDKEIKTAYSALVPNGQGCAPGSQRIYTSLYALREYLCLPCDPREPLYRFESIQGDIVHGGIVSPSTNSVAGEQTWRICRSFLYGQRETLQGLWGDNGSRYDQCGVIVSSCMATPVFNVSTASFQVPSSTCNTSNELTIPSIAFRNTSDPALEMLSMVAQSMPYFQIVVVDDNDPSYIYEKTPCFGRDIAVTVPSAALLGWVHAVALMLILSI